MFHSNRWVTQEGLGLSMCRKILKLMNGEVQYIRESERCYFLVILEVPMPNSVRGITVKSAAD
jgi:phytochrome B